MKQILHVLHPFVVFFLHAMLIASISRAEDSASPSVDDFAQVNEGRYQVFAQSGHQMARQVNLFMNKMLRQYETFFNNQTDKRTARVVVFNKSADFRQYATAAIGQPHPWLAGYCKPSTDAAGNRSFELVVFENAAVWPTLAHEGFHQFLAYELGPRIPVWLNEGLAQYFETSHFLGSTFVVGNPDFGKLRQVQALIKSGLAPPLKEIVQWTPASFYSRAGIAYPMSWALAYYCLKSNHDPTVATEFHRYLDAVKAGGDDLPKAQERFAQDSQRWQSDFNDSFLHLSDAMGLQ